MAIRYNTSIIRSGLTLQLDAANPKSYPGTGTTWIDLSGNGKNGTLTNGPTFSNSSIVFDGVDDFVVSPVSFSLSTTSVSFWVYLDPTINWSTRFDVMSGSIAATTNGRFLFYRLNTTVMQVYIIFPSLAILTFDLTSANTLMTGLWNNIVITSETVGSTTTGKLYRNGQLASSNSIAEAATATSTSLYLMRNQASAFPTKGSISATQVYNRVLSDTEVQQNFEAMRGRYGV